ncbi:MAG: hypothetical protein PHT40_04505 [Patescibacteria group bacterium]|nr:hypothetical protein [Patescibacteria group bacterium]
MEKRTIKVADPDGKTFVVDTTDAECLKYGFRHGDRAVDPHGCRLTIMGVAPVEEGSYDVLWFKLDNHNDVVCWDDDGPQGLNLREEGFRLLSEVEAEAKKTN